MFDTVILNGLLYDGTGNKPFPSDMGIAGGKIKEFGHLSGADTQNLIDAKGRSVCPGFIDAHSHSDTYILIDPYATSKIFQGITTEIIGNCGSSAAPLYRPHRMPSDWEQYKYPGQWHTMAQYRSLLETVKPAINIVPLIGHRNIRVATIGCEQRLVTPDELKKMTIMLERAINQGGRGFSTGLIYAPATSADINEISALAKIVAAYDGIYTTHMRNEGSGVIDAIDETLNVARKTGVRTQISHLKASGKKNWHLLETAFERIEEARNDGLSVASDRYPYTAGCTDLDVVLPDWVHDGGREQTLKRLNDSSTVNKIHKELTSKRRDEEWALITIGSISNPGIRQFRGSSISVVAEQLKLDPVPAILHIIKIDKLQTSAFFFGLSNDNMLKIFSKPYMMVGTDASLRTPDGILGKDFPHPRAYGSFPEYIRLCLENKLLPLEEAIRKITLLPAEHFRIRKRGKLQIGNFADILIFDPEKFVSRSSYAEPHKLTSGVDHLFVNGIQTIKQGKLTGLKSGNVL